MLLNQKILELLNVETSNRGPDWLKSSVQTAIEIEFFTIPPYLSALWSIKDFGDPVYESIRTIVIDEEMLHMGLMCNLLVALGETPQIARPVNFPDNLPGNLNPDLKVYLQGLSIESLETFMTIELPEHGSIVGTVPKNIAAHSKEVSTIGAFYNAILKEFESQQPVLSLTNQQERQSFGLFKISTLEDVRRAIELIKRQGEGSNSSPEDTGPDDLAHYYRFGEIRFGRKIQKNPVTNKWDFDGDAVQFPGVFPMSPVPPGGYRREDVKPEVQTLLETFDTNYSNMLRRLQRAWEGGVLSPAISAMFSLENPARVLMQIPIEGGTGNYGPCFRFV